MGGRIVTTGINGRSFRALLRSGIRKSHPSSLGVAVAYVSTYGLKHVRECAAEFYIDSVRLVTDTKDGITHPSALESALTLGWDVRVVNTLHGTFHPKLYVGGSSFDDTFGVSDVSFVLAGSANLSLGGLIRNGECSFVNSGSEFGVSAGKAWKECWEIGAELTEPMLKAYEKVFAKRNRHRRPEDLVVLGVSDEMPNKGGGLPPKNKRPPIAGLKAISDNVATVSWAGLQSFTGEYNLQLEFPKEAGLVLRRILQGKSHDGVVNVLCVDGETRDFRFKYYDDNGMFRMNIPNSTPLVDWARANRQGIAYVEIDEDIDVIRFRILEPGNLMMEIIDRSLALGTWGRTPTRLYGWF